VLLLQFSFIPFSHQGLRAAFAVAVSGTLPALPPQGLPLALMLLQAKRIRRERREHEAIH